MHESTSGYNWPDTFVIRTITYLQLRKSRLVTKRSWLSKARRRWQMRESTCLQRRILLMTSVGNTLSSPKQNTWRRRIVPLCRMC